MSFDIVVVCVFVDIQESMDIWRIQSLEERELKINTDGMEYFLNNFSLLNNERVKVIKIYETMIHKKRRCREGSYIQHKNDG